MVVLPLEGGVVTFFTVFRPPLVVGETGTGIPDGLMGEMTGRGIFDLPTGCVGEGGGDSVEFCPLSISHLCCNFLNLLPFNGFSSE